MKKLLLVIPLLAALGGCSTFQGVLSDISAGLGTASNVIGTFSSAVPALCTELNQLSTTVSQSGAVTPAQAAAIAAGQTHYDTYCGPIALDAATIAAASAALQADISALQTP